MEAVTGAGKLSQILNQIFDSFLKSLEGLFTSAAKTEEKFEKGKYIRTTTDKPQKPPVGEDGKPLPESRMIFDIVIGIQWPRNEKLTRNQAVEIIKDKNTWAKAKNMGVVLTLGGKNKVEKTNITASRVDSEIKQYRRKFDVDHKATLIRQTVQFMFTEVDEEETPAPEEENANASTKMNIRLKKITNGNDIEVRLMKINANYAMSDALEDVDKIISDDDFVDQLPEGEEINYEVTSDETDYDVNECEDFTCQDSIQQMIYDTFQLSLQLKLIDMAGPYDMYGGPANSFGGIPYSLDCIISILTNNLIDMGCTTVPGFELVTEPIELSTQQTSYTFVVGMIEGYLSSLTTIYECVSEGSQFKLGQHISTLEDTLRWLKQEIK